MDLPSCPSCGQSVLDENPETCPFCGAAMSSSGGKASATEKKAKNPPQKKQLTSKDEDPFAIETSTQKAAVRVALRKAPGRTHAVTCPMCETSGYVPEAAAGKSVKCANPSCMVPVFEAPKLEKVEEPKPESSGSSLFMLIFAVIFLGAAGGAVWFFVLREPPQDPNEIENLANQQNQKPVEKIEYNPVFENDNKNENEEDNKPFDPVVYRRELLTNTIPTIARQREWNSQTNRQADCRQLLAEAFARIGLLDPAKEQLEKIDQYRKEAFFNKRLMPLVEIAWREKDATKRKELIAEAEKAAAESPTAGRIRFDDLSGLAALLVSEGRQADAIKWLETAVKKANISDERQFDRLRQSSSQLRVLRDLEGYPISPLISHSAHKWAQPEWVTVTMLLLAHGEDEKALAWIQGAPTDRVRADALLAYTRWKALTGELTADQLVKLVASEPPAAKTRILSDAAVFFASGGQKEDAKIVLDVATQQLDNLQGGNEFLIPAPAELLNYEIPDPSAVLNQILALLALARAQDAVGENDEAWNIMQRALTLARSIGPTPSALAARPHDQNDVGADAIKSELREKLGLENENTLRIRFNSYVKKLTELEASADLRVQTLETLLSEALLWGQAVNVWEEMQTRIDQTDEDLKEPFLKSSLLPEVQAALQQANASSQLNELNRRIGATLPARDAQLVFLFELDRMIAAKDFSNLESALNTSKIDRERLEMSLLDRLLPIAKVGDLELTVSAIQALPKRISSTRMDLTVMKEELNYFLGRIAGQIGQAKSFQKLVQKQLPAPVEEVSTLAGICVGVEISQPNSGTSEVEK
ncbi:MAG: hypothetical protein P8M30_07395 [Planctomycetaceae bacterium]|nr:hypothetical protein [Planctomycetaceae bacterium]MDG2389128.1 hypothetical protein [Planctomycetaceae bacterium]